MSSRSPISAANETSILAPSTASHGASTTTIHAESSSIIAAAEDEMPRYRRAYSKLLGMIQSLPPEQFVPVNLDVMSLVRTTEGVLLKIADMRPAIEQQLPLFRIELFDQLENRALALGHAQTVYETMQQPPAALKPLYAQAYKARTIAKCELNTLVQRALIADAALANLNGGNGYNNLTADLFKTADIMRTHWTTICKRTSMNLKDLDDLEHLADQLNKTLGIREQMPKLRATAARDRQAAYTLFIKAYNEVRTAIAYIRREEGDVDTLMPSLYAGRRDGKDTKKRGGEGVGKDRVVVEGDGAPPPVTVVHQASPNEATAEVL